MKENHATRVPTVLIGIGGIGGQIVRLVNHELRQYDKQFVQMLVLDTNTNDLSKSINVNIPYVQTSENMTVSDYLNQDESFQEWFPMNPLINAKNLTQGAGQIRSVSRLGALASEGAHRFDAIRHAIEDVNRNTGASLHNMVRVMIVGSVCGGTGSGMGIQLPFLVRDLMEEIAHMPRTIIRGLFIMPDIVEEVQDTDEKKRSVYVNGYAFLRELNAFNKAQTFQRGTEKLNIEHYKRPETDLREDPTQMAHQVPYDFLFLLEKSNKEGQNIGGFDAYISKAAQIVKAQLFASDMTADLLSSEDNLIVSAVNKNGLNRFCGAGIARAIYPEDENFRYCTLRFSESILQGYWLNIDRIVDVNTSLHKRQMATNPALLPMDPREEYINVFNKLTDPNEREVTAAMGMLKRELILDGEYKDENGNTKIKSISIVERLSNSIKYHISSRFDCAELENAAAECVMEERELKSNDAINYCDEKLRLLKRYERIAKERVSSLVAGTIDDILGADYEIAKLYSDGEKYTYNIAAAIKDKHPIVARYLLYYICRELEKDLLSTEAIIAVKEKEETIFKHDYFYTGENDKKLDNPSEALAQTKAGWLKIFGISSAAYKSLVSEIVQDAGEFVKTVNELSIATLKKEVYYTVIKRLETMIGIYEDFFNELEVILYKNRSERELLEEARPRVQNSDIYVCEDPYCKEWLYKKFEGNLSGFDISLPDDVKTSFSDAIFKEYVNKYAAETDSTVFAQKPLSMRELFEGSILRPLTDKYKDKEMAHIHMDILSALKLEYQIHSQKGVLRVNDTPVDPVDYDFEQYFAAVALRLKNLSAPYLAYGSISQSVNNLLTPNADVSDVDAKAKADSPTSGRVLCYWGVNNQAVARYQKKESGEHVDRNSLNDMFGKPNGETYFTVNDDSFDPKELVCYSSIYDFVVENLSKYKKGSKAYSEYYARLLRVIKSDYSVGTGSAAYLDTVHPHLDRHWHAHAYLPMLSIDEELEEQKRIARAFLLSLACRRVMYQELDHKLCWTFRKNDRGLPKPLAIDGKPAERASFHTLYSALDENTVVVNDILRQADAATEKVYNQTKMNGIKTADVLKHPIIAGLVGGKYTADEASDMETMFKTMYVESKKGTVRQPLNILSVIYSIYQDSYDLELVTQLVDHLTAYLKEYCLKMKNSQSGAAEVMFRAVAKAIGKNFDTTDVNTDFLMLCETYTD